MKGKEGRKGQQNGKLTNRTLLYFWFNLRYEKDHEGEVGINKKQWLNISIHINIYPTRRPSNIELILLAKNHGLDLRFNLNVALFVIYCFMLFLKKKIKNKRIIIKKENNLEEAPKCREQNHRDSQTLHRWKSSIFAHEISLSDKGCGGLNENHQKLCIWTFDSKWWPSLKRFRRFGFIQGDKLLNMGVKSLEHRATSCLPSLSVSCLLLEWFLCYACLLLWPPARMDLYSSGAVSKNKIVLL